MRNKKVSLRRTLVGNLGSLSENVNDSVAVYTDNGIPVYNVFIKNSPRSIDRKSILRHFSKFGLVKSTKMVNGKKRRQSAKWVIEFESKKGAARALKKRFHVIKNQHCFVKLCPSWQQPFEAFPYILGMTYDSLEIIYKCCSLQQQIQLSLCHKYLEEVFVGIICPRLPRHRNLHELTHLKAWELRQFFHTAGPYLESLQVGPDTTYTEALTYSYDLIRENCFQLSNLYMEHSKVVITKMLNSVNIDSIREVQLLFSVIDDSELKLLRRFPNLETLGLFGSEDICGDSLRHLRKLQRLSLFGCENIKRQNLLACCCSIKLRYLDLRSTTLIQGLASHIGYCSELETLKVAVDCYSPLESVFTLPRLKRFEMISYFGISLPRRFFRGLAEHLAHNLEELKINGHGYYLDRLMAQDISRLKKLRVLSLDWGNENTNFGTVLEEIAELPALEEFSLRDARAVLDYQLCPVIAKCKNLKRLNLRGCDRITEQFVWRAIKILAHRETAGQTQPLLVLVYTTGIPKKIVQDHKYITNRHLIKLLFHPFLPLWDKTMSEDSPFDISDDELTLPVTEQKLRYNHEDRRFSLF